MRIDEIEIDEHIDEKIERKHGVLFVEVEGACFSRARHLRRGREGLLSVLSVTAAGRYLFVVLAATSEFGLWRVVTARDMNASERRLYARHRR
jgi:uncharacterized DUF497 family protein